MKVIQSVLLIILLIIQIIVMIYLLYINHKRFQEDKKFWERQEKIFEDITNDSNELVAGVKYKGEQ